MATIYSCLCENGDATGSYFDNLSETDKSRYGVSGSYRVYGLMEDWFNARSVVTNQNNTEILEICDSFLDGTHYASFPTFTYAAFPAYKIIITTKIDGVRTAGFHNGQTNSGYVWFSQFAAGFYLNRSNIELDGFRIRCLNTGTQSIRTSQDKAFQVVSNCVVQCSTGTAFSFEGTASKYYNNIAFSSTYGFKFPADGMISSLAYNNLSVNNYRGFDGGGATTGGNYHNNVAYNNSIGNYTGTIPGGSDGGMYNNAGEPGDSPWGSNPVTTITSSDFLDYANNDFRLVSTSNLVDAGYDFFDLYGEDIIGVERPNFAGVGVTAYPDIGPFEYDYNLVPAESYDFTLIGIPSGSEIRIYEKSATPGIIGTELSGIESWTGGDYVYNYEYSGSSITIAVQVLSDGYEESLTYYDISNNNQTIPIILTEEENL